MKLARFIVLLSSLFLSTVSANSDGAGRCAVGEASPQGLHLFGNVETGTLESNGSNDYTITINGQNGVNLGTVTAIAGVPFTVDISGPQFKGALIMVAGQDASAIEPGPNLKYADGTGCGDTASITHTGPSLKTSAMGTVTVDTALTTTLELNIVVQNSGGVSTYYYSQVNLQVNFPPCMAQTGGTVDPGTNTKITCTNGNPCTAISGCDEVICNGADSCRSTSITTIPGASVQCTGTNACQGTTINLLGDGTVQCDSDDACPAAILTTTGTANISCLGLRACNGATIGTSGNPFQEVICDGGDFACQNANIYSACVTCGSGTNNVCDSCVFNGSGACGDISCESSSPSAFLSNAPTVSTAPSSAPVAEDKGSSRRRMLSSALAVPLTLDDAEYHAYLAKCGHVDYEVSLYVDPDAHLFAVGVPKKDQDNMKPDLAAECPVGATHAIISKDAATKEILLWHDKDEHASVFGTDATAGSLLPMGTFKLADMAHAYEVASAANKQGHHNGLYNLVTNNCASYLINLATELGIQVDTPRVTAFVASRLMEEQGKELAEMIRNRIDMLSMLLPQRDSGGGRRLGELAGKEEVTDSKIVELLVEHNVKQR